MKNKTINVLIVNDSPLISAVIKAVLEAEPNIKVAASVRTGIEAVSQSRLIMPDIILMDIHMPEMDGVEATRRIIAHNPKSRILITTATVNRNMSYIFDALKYGAIDYTRSPSLPFAPGTQIDKKMLKNIGERLVQKIATVLNVSFKVLSPDINHGVIPNNKVYPLNYTVTNNIPVAGVGCSTGGPTTLVIFLKNLPPSFPGTVLVCQHIEPGFDNDFVNWVASETKLKVSIAQNGTIISSGNVYISPAGKNMIITNNIIGIERPDSKHIYVPNIDRLFFTMAQSLGKRACGVVMTGMGNDGAAGAKAILENKGDVYIQNEESAIIDSMPKSARISTGSKNCFPPAQLGAVVGNWMIRYCRMN